MAKSEWEWLQVVKKYGGDLIKVPVAIAPEEYRKNQKNKNKK